ncbi:MAG: hypothetical protein LBG17_09450 [Bacteroidales bacterium]|jgi:hypothetical protein|nr:hypothetical protein [Bacteroidales bacterium]
MKTRGITIQTTYSGTPMAITFDIKQYGKLLRDFFIEKGIEYPATLVKVPNITTLRAMEEVENNKTVGFKSVSELLTDLKK